MDNPALLVGNVVVFVAYFESVLSLDCRWVAAELYLTLGAVESAKSNVMYICFLAMERRLVIQLKYLGWLGS